MATYSYRCAEGHVFEARYPIGAAPNDMRCYEPSSDGECCQDAHRDFSADFATVSVRNDDPFRKAWLSSSIDSELQKQQRPLDPLAPKDKMEAKHVREKTGRVYVGDDISGFCPKTRDAILRSEHGTKAKV